jgi:hypothetical protein
MATQRKQKKRRREQHNRLVRLCHTPDSELSPAQRFKKHFHLAIERTLLFGS